MLKKLQNLKTICTIKLGICKKYTVAGTSQVGKSKLQITCDENNSKLDGQRVTNMTSYIPIPNIYVYSYQTLVITH